MILCKIQSLSCLKVSILFNYKNFLFIERLWNFTIWTNGWNLRLKFLKFLRFSISSKCTWPIFSSLIFWRIKIISKYLSYAEAVKDRADNIRVKTYENDVFSSNILSFEFPRKKDPLILIFISNLRNDRENVWITVKPSVFSFFHTFTSSEIHSAYLSGKIYSAKDWSLIKHRDCEFFLLRARVNLRSSSLDRGKERDHHARARGTLTPRHDLVSPEICISHTSRGNCLFRLR